ncbi:hypothetical protein [Chryseobacterium sp. JUb7]|uniref:hypothetical protein n=1 Tax=Chryseobacterium sp. JUb7 TaxID=2940599 RepID=UPI00216868F0|nr:hypothetical protein [Chryseobacterium sp. JUb7]MCS3533058.1 hypothetical protein [Chryseobacterium sp. JUb7]
MRRIILIVLFAAFSCVEKNIEIEKKVSFSNLNEPEQNIYIELLEYYPAQNKKQSNFYVVKNIHNNDTLYVIDKDNLPISDFIKNYKGVENTAIVLEKGEFQHKNEYLINIPGNYNLDNKKLYLGELIHLID